MGHLEGDPHIFQNIMFRLEAAAVAIDDQCGGALLKRPAERIYTGNSERHGLHNSCCASLLGLDFRMNVRLSH